jgi:DNA-binding transcriptional regulator YdaS (Cro superfamily)
MDRYARAFAEAMDSTGTRNTTVAAHARVGSNNVSQWRTGRRPIPAERAVAIAALMGVAPERISEGYERLLHAGYTPPHKTLSIGSRTAASPVDHVTIERLAEFGHAEGSTRILLPDFLARRKVGLAAIEQVRWTFQPSHAMEPEIERHALVLVDIAATRHDQVVDGGTYAYSLWGRPDIRRLLIRRDHWLVMGHGKDAEYTEVQGSELSNLKIFGAVLGAL